MFKLLENELETGSGQGRGGRGQSPLLLYNK